MTTTRNQRAKPKQVPDFYIFAESGSSGAQERKLAGAAFSHKTGSGFMLVIGGRPYAAFPPKAKAVTLPARSGQRRLPGKAMTALPRSARVAYLCRQAFALLGLLVRSSELIAEMLARL